MGTDSAPLFAICLLLRWIPSCNGRSLGPLGQHQNFGEWRHEASRADIWRWKVTCGFPSGTLIEAPKAAERPQSPLPHVSCPPVFCSSLIHFQGNTSSFIPWDPTGSLGS